jgi:shikimate dehydrogenase
MNKDLFIVDGATRLYGIVGDPIVQVRSPEVMTAKFRAAGSNAILVPFQVAPDAFEETMRGIMRIRNLDGLVITVPYKARAVAVLDRLLPTGERVGAINALRREPDGTWSGEMFDGAGLVRGLRGQGFEISGSRVKMLGAGGAGSAVAVALAEAGAASIAIHDIDAGRADLLASRVSKYFPGSAARAVQNAASVDGCTLLVNCSPIGMAPGDGMPASFGHFDSSLMVVDVIMKPEVTPLAEHARSCGCRVMNGRPMLEGQALAIMEFFGIGN